MCFIISCTKISYLLLFLLILGFFSNSEAVCKKPFIDILVSPIFEDGVTNKLELIWHVEELQPESLLVLMNRVTRTSVFQYKLECLSGSVETNVSYPNSANVTYGFKKQSLDFYVELHSNKSKIPLLTSSLETNPTWMMDNAAVFKQLTIGEMFIPGTHDAGASTNEDNHGESRVQKYIMTQDETILNQLIFGIRSIDLRVGYYSVNSNDSSKLYLNHGIQRICPFSLIVADIKMFMENTKEIVVLDLHQFPMGFTNIPNVKAHDILVSYLKEELGEYIAPTNLTWNAKLQDFWEVGRTLILAYNDKETQQKHSDILWTPINQRWANAQNIGNMKKYMDIEFQNPPLAPWSAMVELTATGMNILTDDMKGLRQMAYSVNKEVSLWFLGDWGSKAHIVACDFFRETSVVKTAILWNLRRVRNSTCDI